METPIYSLKTPIFSLESPRFSLEVTCIFIMTRLMWVSNENSVVSKWKYGGLQWKVVFNSTPLMKILPRLFCCKVHDLSWTLFGVRGGAEPPGPPTRAPSWGGSSVNITSACISLPQAIYILHCIALTQTKRLRKEIKCILIYNNTLQCLIKYCI